MPRPAWLAIGASVGAVALDLAPSPVVLILRATSGRAVSVALQASGRTRPARRSAALALGMLAIAIRLATAPAPPAVGVAPHGDGPWLGVVQSVSAPRAGARPALVQLETKPSVLLAAPLPWYPRHGLARS